MFQMALSVDELNSFIDGHFENFQQWQLAELKKLTLERLIFTYNPYYLNQKQYLLVGSLINSLIMEYFQPYEEAFINELMMQLAIFVCKKVYDGKKSTAEGIDLEFEKDGIVYLVAIKSGPNWGNSSQIARMKVNFKQAQKRLRQNKGVASIVTVNGCCYGKDNRPDKGDYLKLTGQRFWEFISGMDKPTFLHLLREGRAAWDTLLERIPASRMELPGAASACPCEYSC